MTRIALAARAAVLALVLPLAATPTPAAAAAPDGDALYLVTLRGGGTAARDTGAAASAPSVGTPIDRARMRATQTALLTSVDAGEPVYQWSTALNGMAARLTVSQARELAADPRVATVEADAVRPLAGARARTPTFDTSRASTGGRGVVVGIVDSGITPESTAFATRPSLGPLPSGFTGTCVDGEDWSPSRCGAKIVAARWYVDGFGRDRLRVGAHLSARDDDGHGTQMASIAAGNADVAVRVGGRRVSTTSGRAPDARLAVYKACWTAPDPRDDGCSSADLVTAVDQAVRDGVDVLSLSVAGPDRVDTLERALLGAAEADVVVLGAAGNGGATAYAAHPVPWVTTVGGAEGVQPRGTVSLAGGPSFVGATATRTTVGPAPLVLAADARRAGADAEEAAVCAEGALDAAAVAGRVVVCRRGRVGRVDKSATVALAGGVAMVLVNGSGRSTYADFHTVPTVHLDARDGRALEQHVRSNAGARATISPRGAGRSGGLAPWSAPGDPVGGMLKPDLVAPGTGLLGAVPPEVREAGWDVASGTSAATAWAAGSAAALRARHPGWTAIEVRSALATTTTRVRDASALGSGAGRVAPGRADGVRLSYPETPRAYRGWLEGRRTSLNVPSVLLADGRTSATRTVRNTARRALYFSSSARGFRGDVEVVPAAVRLAPGETATFEVSVARVPRRLDDGYVVWRGGDGSRSRIPVAVGR